MPFNVTLRFLTLTRYIDSQQNMACNLHVAQGPLTKGVLFAPGNTDVNGDVEKSRAAGRQATTNLNSSKPRRYWSDDKIHALCEALIASEGRSDP